MKNIVKAPPVVIPAASKEDRAKAIAEAAARKAKQSSPTVTLPSPEESKKAKALQASADLKARLAKDAAKAKAPRVDDTSTVTVPSTSAKKPEKVVRDANTLTVSDIANELGVDPKRARARLRAAGQAAVEGRWPTVLRGSPDHKVLAAIIADPEAVKAALDAAEAEVAAKEQKSKPARDEPEEDEADDE